jgi:hypothetical protein
VNTIPLPIPAGFGASNISFRYLREATKSPFVLDPGAFAERTYLPKNSGILLQKRGLSASESHCGKGEQERGCNIITQTRLAEGKELPVSFQRSEKGEAKKTHFTG